MNTQIRVVVVYPDLAPIVTAIPNTLEAMQEVVDGWIEVFPIGIEGVVGICNEEGILRGLPWCRFVPAAGTFIAGTFLVVGDGAHFDSLTQTQIDEALKLFELVME